MSMKDPKGLGEYLQICFVIIDVGMILSLF